MNINFFIRNYTHTDDKNFMVKRSSSSCQSKLSRFSYPILQEKFILKNDINFLKVMKVLI